MNAALNTLREERRRVVEVRQAVFADAALKAEDARAWRALLRQMATELVEHDRAIRLLEQIGAGTGAVPSEARWAAVTRLHAAGPWRGEARA